MGNIFKEQEYMSICLNVRIRSMKPKVSQDESMRKQWVPILATMK